MTAEEEGVGLGGVATLDRPVAVSDAREAPPLSAEHLGAVSGQAVIATADPLPVQDQAAVTRDVTLAHRGAMGARDIAAVDPEDGRTTAPGPHRAVVSKRLKFPSSLSSISF